MRSARNSSPFSIASSSPRWSPAPSPLAKSASGRKRSTPPRATGAYCSETSTRTARTIRTSDASSPRICTRKRPVASRESVAVTWRSSTTVREHLQHVVAGRVQETFERQLQRVRSGPTNTSADDPQRHRDLLGLPSSRARA
jgi:hypothetical protein